MKYLVSAHANRYIGIALIIISAISFGVMPIFARLAYESGADPITVLVLRFGIAAAVDYAIYILLGSRIVRRSGSIGSTSMIIAATAGVYAIIAPIHGLAFPGSALGWIAVLTIALISTVIAFVTFIAGLKRIGPTTASTLSTFEPIVAVALAALVLGETITPVQALGGLLILIAVVILSRNEMRRDKQTSTE